MNKRGESNGGVCKVKKEDLKYEIEDLLIEEASLEDIFLHYYE